MSESEAIVSHFIKAELCLSYWKAERKNLGSLLAPRTDWMILRYRHMVRINYLRVCDHIDIIIPTHKLYQDLYESA